MASRQNNLKPKNVSYKCLVSACLAGRNCTYKGSNKLNRTVANLLSQDKAIAVCPEMLGGLTSPRERCEISGGIGKDVVMGKAKVLTMSGKDISPYLIRGAKKAASIVKKHGIEVAILKSKSPSCGCGKVYDGTFSDKLIEGDGVLAHMLRTAGLRLYTEKYKNLKKIKT